MLINTRENPETIMRYRVYLNGVDVSGSCVEADDHAGYVRLIGAVRIEAVAESKSAEPSPKE